MKWLLLLLPISCQAQYLEIGSNKSIEATWMPEQVGLAVGYNLNHTVTVAPRTMANKDGWLLNLQPGLSFSTVGEGVGFFGKVGTGYMWRSVYGLGNLVVAGKNKLIGSFVLSLGIKIGGNGNRTSGQYKK